MITGETRSQSPHAVLPVATLEEEARQEFVVNLKFHIAMELTGKVRAAYDNRAKPTFEREHGRAPQDWREIKSAMKDQPAYRYWSALQRASQEMMWQSCQTSIERQSEDLSARAKVEKSLGTLRLNEDLEMPRYITAVDIHCMPGNYHNRYYDGDISQGALYDRGVYLYTMGRIGNMNDDLGRSLARYIKETYPDLKPKMILDLGCSVGHSTIPYAEYFPEAEIHAVDVGGPLLEYGHARAESLGKKIHFSQQNAEHLDFPDNSFDLVVSHILVHETANRAMRNIMKEAHRVLKPGGLTAHAETPPYRALDPYDAFALDWDARNNNEPFWTASHRLDLEALAGQAGFDPKDVFEWNIPSATAQPEQDRSNTFQCGDMGGSGSWYVFGAWKK